MVGKRNESGKKVFFETFRVVVLIFKSCCCLGFKDVQIQNLILQVTLEEDLENVMDGNPHAAINLEDDDADEESRDDNDNEGSWGFGDDDDDDQAADSDNQPDLEVCSSSDDGPQETRHGFKSPAKNKTAAGAGNAPPTSISKRRISSKGKVMICVCKLCGVISDKDW